MEKFTTIGKGVTEALTNSMNHEQPNGWRDKAQCELSKEVGTHRDVSIRNQTVECDLG
jgi:hypothetical protein